VCGVSPKTVARLRDELARSAPQLVPIRRVGRDGRARPIDPVELRARITEELERRPEASLRSIAAAVGSSPETVRSVRGKLKTVDRGSVNPELASVDTEATVLGLLTRRAHTGHRLEGDQAFSTREGGCEFIEWFDSTAVEPADQWAHVGSVPRSRIYEVRRSPPPGDVLEHFADSLKVRFVAFQRRRTHPRRIRCPRSSCRTRSTTPTTTSTNRPTSTSGSSTRSATSRSGTSPIDGRELQLFAVGRRSSTQPGHVLADELTKMLGDAVADDEPTDRGRLPGMLPTG
jgi:hypothetical protein